MALPTVPVAAPASPPQDRALPANTVHGKQTMAQEIQKASLASDFTELKELFGPSPVLSSEDSKAYDTMLKRILKSLEPRDFIEEMFGKDLTDATWELKRYSRHKALVVERQIHEQQEMEETGAFHGLAATSLVSLTPSPKILWPRFAIYLNVRSQILGSC